MKINTNVVLKDYEGKDLTHNVEEDGKIVLKPMTLLHVIITAINNITPTETLTAEEKMMAYGLSLKLYVNSEVDLTVEDIIFIKKRILAIWNNPVTVGKSIDILEQKQLN